MGIFLKKTVVDTLFKSSSDGIKIRSFSGWLPTKMRNPRDEEGFDEVEVVVAGRNSVKVGGKGERAEKLFLHYAQR